MSYKSKYEQMSEHDYTFFNKNAFKSKINQTDLKTLSDSHDMNSYLKNISKFLLAFLMTIKKLSKKEKSLIDIPWIDNFLGH